ncbi:MAG TPA: hypothetical protein VNA57_05685 [Acidimicrobiales bacterium]|nr:hypothetical protein [Acidimicrobiales bacterium]
MNLTPRSVAAAMSLTLATATFLGACGGGSGSSAAKAKAKPTSIEDALGMDEASMQAREAKVQEEVRRCMQAEGFDYVPMDPSQQHLVRIGPGGGNDDKEFRRTKGYGISTVLGEGFGGEGGAGRTDPNQKIREALSEEDRKAYDRALFGAGVEGAGGPGGGIIVREGPGVEGRDASPGGKVDGGCLQAANKKVGGDNFEKVGPELQELEERVRSDARMVKADAAWSRCMAGAGYDFERPEDIPPALFERMNKLAGAPESGSGFVSPPDPDSPELAELQRDELAMAKADDECSERTGRGAVAKKVRAEAERRFLEENPDFGSESSGR